MHLCFHGLEAIVPRRQRHPAVGKPVGLVVHHREAIACEPEHEVDASGQKPADIPSEHRVREPFGIPVERVARTKALLEDTSDVEHRNRPVRIVPARQRKFEGNLVQPILAGMSRNLTPSTIGPSGVSIAATSPDTSRSRSPRWIARRVVAAPIAAQSQDADPWRKSRSLRELRE